MACGGCAMMPSPRRSSRYWNQSFYSPWSPKRTRGLKSWRRRCRELEWWDGRPAPRPGTRALDLKRDSAPRGGCRTPRRACGGWRAVGSLAPPRSSGSAAGGVVLKWAAVAAPMRSAGSA